MDDTTTDPRGDTDDTETSSADDASTDTADDIVRATYCALCKHGYADLTMQNIADESDKSKAALHYHFDTKQDLLLAFLDYLYDRFEERIDSVSGEDAQTRLVSLVETVLEPPTRRRTAEFKTAMLEINAQAPYCDEYRTRLQRFDRRLEERIADVVADGVAAGTFRDDVDPEAVATFVNTLLRGAQMRSVTVGCSMPDVEESLRRYVERDLLADDAASRVAE